MSDAGRKNFADKIEENLTPDSQKTNFQKGKETVTNAVDNLAAQVQPTENKGVAQHAADAAHESKQDVSQAGSSVYDQAREKLHELQKEATDASKPYITKAQEYVKEASEYIQGKEKK